MSRTFVIVLVLACPALACNCISSEASQEVLWAYRSITVLLSSIPLALAGVFFYVARAQGRGSDTRS